jgi:hypothetical protein
MGNKLINISILGPLYADLTRLFLIGAAVVAAGASPSAGFGLPGVVVLLEVLEAADVLAEGAGVAVGLSIGLDSDVLSEVAGAAEGITTGASAGSSIGVSLLITSAPASIGIPIPIKVPTGMDSLKSFSLESKKPQAKDKELAISSKKLNNKR